MPLSISSDPAGYHQCSVPVTQGTQCRPQTHYNHQVQVEMAVVRIYENVLRARQVSESLTPINSLLSVTSSGRLCDYTHLMTEDAEVGKAR